MLMGDDRKLMQGGMKEGATRISQKDMNWMNIIGGERIPRRMQAKARYQIKLDNNIFLDKCACFSDDKLT